MPTMIPSQVSQATGNAKAKPAGPIPNGDAAGQAMVKGQGDLTSKVKALGPGSSTEMGNNNQSDGVFVPGMSIPHVVHMIPEIVPGIPDDGRGMPPEHLFLSHPATTAAVGMQGGHHQMAAHPKALRGGGSTDNRDASNKPYISASTSRLRLHH